MGEVGTIVRDAMDNERTVPRNGLFAEWPDGVDGPVLREQARVRFQRDGGLTGGIYHRVRKRRYGPQAALDAAFWAPCSHGGHLNRVGGPPHEDTVIPG
jgi:hypothetical protein